MTIFQDSSLRPDLRERAKVNAARRHSLRHRGCRNGYVVREHFGARRIVHHHRTEDEFLPAGLAGSAQGGRDRRATSGSCFRDYAVLFVGYGAFHITDCSSRTPGDIFRGLSKQSGWKQRLHNSCRDKHLHEPEVKIISGLFSAGRQPMRGPKPQCWPVTLDNFVFRSVILSSSNPAEILLERAKS